MDNIKLYEQEKHWGKLKKDFKFLDKVRMIKALIPEDVKTILDVGCGDGALTNLLSRERYQIVGYDRSEEALKHVEVEKKKGGIDYIQFPDKSFDLLICSQVLEHIPDTIYQKSIDELCRVTKKYIVIGVPYKEMLREHYSKCKGCNKIFHLWGHLRSYKDINAISKRLKNFDLDAYFFTNTADHVHSLTTFIKQKIFDLWDSNDIAVCPYCQMENCCVKNKITGLNKYILDRIIWRLGVYTEPWWMVGLWRKR